jgi:hypothetical protein
MVFRGFVFLILFFGPWQAAANQYEPFTENGKVGLKESATQAVIIPPTYEALGWSNHTFQVIDGVLGARKNEKWALINTDGSKVTQHLYQDLFPTPKGHIIVSQKAQHSILREYGVIDSRGKMIVPTEYSKLTPAHEGLIATQKKGGQYLTGYISERGSVIIPIEHIQITPINQFLAVSSKDGLTAIFNDKGKRLTHFDYNRIEVLGTNYFKVSRYNHFGLLNNNLEAVVPMDYSRIDIEDNHIVASTYPQWDEYSSEGFTRSHFFNTIEVLSNGHFVSKSHIDVGLLDRAANYLSFSDDQELIKAGRHGYVTRNKNDNRLNVYDVNGKSLFRDSFEEVQLYDEVFFGKISQADGHNWSVFDYRGKKINLFNYQSIVSLNNGYFQAQRNDKIGLLGSNGKETTPFLYDYLSDFTSDRAIAYYNGNYGMINSKGLWIMTPYYDSLRFIDQQYVYYKQGTEWGLADWYGKPIYRDQSDFNYSSGAIIKMSPNGTYRLYQFNGTPLLEHYYQKVISIDPNTLLLERDGKRFFFKPTDQEAFALDTSIDSLGKQLNDFIPIRKNAQWGFINTRAQLTIANRYEEVGQYSEGLFSVKLIGKWGFVNEDETLIIQPNFDQVEAFRNGLSIVESASRWGIIDINGQAVVSLNYDLIERIEDYFLLYADSKIGLASGDGQIIKNPSFDSIVPLSNGYFLVERQGLYGVIHKSGNDILPTIYKSIKQYGELFLGFKGSETKKYKLN